MKAKIAKIALGLLFTVCMTSAAQANILDFTEVSNGFQGSTTISLSNATINSFGTDSFVYAPGDFGALGGGGFCGISGSVCEAGAEVLFTSAISDLTLNSQYFNTGDSSLLEIFSGATLLSSIAVTSDAIIDFTGFSGITRLSITDSSTGAGFAYTNFEFNTSAVPAPGVLGLMLIGLAGLVIQKKRTV